MPTFKNISEVLSEKHPQELIILINDIDPQTSLNIGHDLKGFPNGSIMPN